jgi:cupin superfamily acireductone dioxygenase involved in methionine salvage
MYLTFVTPITGVSARKVNIPTPETCKVIKLTIEILIAVPKNTAHFFSIGVSNLNTE